MLYSTSSLVTCFIHNIRSVYASISVSQFLPSALPLACLLSRSVTSDSFRPRSAGHLHNLEGARKEFSPGTPRRNAARSAPCFQSSGTHFRVLISRIIGQQICAVLGYHICDTLLQQQWGPDVHPSIYGAFLHILNQTGRLSPLQIAPLLIRVRFPAPSLKNACDCIRHTQIIQIN